MKLSAFALMAVAMLGLLAFAAPAHAASPAIAQTVGGSALSSTSITLTLTGVTAGDAIVVVEYWSSAFNPLSYIKTPTDSQQNNWQAFGGVVDSEYSAQQVFYVKSAGSGTDTVTCNWQPNSGDVEACYAFDVTAPGTISLLTTQTGVSGTFGTSFNTVQNGLILNTVGLNGICSTLTIFGYIAPQPAPYNPPTECTFGYGLAGSYQVAAGGADQWFVTVNGASFVGTGFQAWTESVVQIAPQSPAVTTTTVYTATVIGWLVPDAAHFSNALLLLILPLAGFGFGAWIPMMFHRKGDVAVYFALAGLTAGSLVADLPANSGDVTGVPFAFTIVAALLTFLYWYNS